MTKPVNPPVTAVCADAEEIKPGSVAAKLKIAMHTTLLMQRLNRSICAPSIWPLRYCRMVEMLTCNVRVMILRKNVPDKGLSYPAYEIAGPLQARLCA
ncbi:MAG: hypothetical protein WBQ79_07125 [Acidobacteriaceae bacterium]